MLQVFRRSVIPAQLISALLLVPPLPGFAQDTRPETSQHLGDVGAVRPMARNSACPSERKPCLSTGEIKDLQASLNKMGFDAGLPDGVFGLRTMRAIERFRQDIGYAGEDPPKRSEILTITRYGERTKKPAAKPVGGIERGAAGVIAGMVTGTLMGNPGNLRKQSGNLGAHRPKPTGALAPESQPAAMPITKSADPPMPTRLFSGPNQFEPRDFRGYGFLAFPATAGEFDFERHMIFCQAFMNSLPSSSAVSVPTINQFATVWPIDERKFAELLNNHRHRSETPTACKVAINNYDGLRAHAVLRKIRTNEGIALDGLGPYLFGWIPAEDFGEDGKLILMLDLSRVSTYEQALIQLQSWQQKIETNPELLNDGFSIENLRRLVRDWSDQHGQAFLVLLGAA